MNNKPDPILQQAAKEIANICDKYEIGGYIILASKTNGEYLMHFPKWSKLFFEGDALRFRAKGKDEDKTVESTVHMIQVFQKQSAQVAGGMDRLLELLETKMFITGGPKRI